MMSEAEVQSRIMMEAAKYGIVLTRNNVGAGKFVDEETGNTSYVRFGLWNDSPKRNKVFKSSDLVGVWTQNYFDAQMNMVTVANWVVAEIKKEGWKYTGTPREKAQLAFINFMKSRGAYAGFAASVDDFLKIIGKA